MGDAGAQVRVNDFVCSHGRTEYIHTLNSTEATSVCISHRSLRGERHQEVEDPSIFVLQNDVTTAWSKTTCASMRTSIMPLTVPWKDGLNGTGEGWTYAGQ